MKFKSILKTVLSFGVGMAFGYLIKAAMDISDEDLDEVENDEYDEEDDDDFYDPDMDDDEEFESEERPEAESKEIFEEENAPTSVTGQSSVKKENVPSAKCSSTHLYVENENVPVAVNAEKAETNHAVCSDLKDSDGSQNESILGVYGSTVDPKVTSMSDMKSYVDAQIEAVNRRRHEETTETPLIKPEDC